MRCFTWLGGMTLGLVFATVSLADDEPKLEFKVIKPAPRLINDVIVEKSARKYSLGSKLTGVPESLDTQLSLEGKGALVAEVTPGGPADKAGVKQHDVLVRINETTVTGLASVTDLLNASEGKEISLTLIRGGKEFSLKVQPDVLQVVKPKPVISVHTEIEEEDVVPALGAIHEELRAVEEKVREKLRDAGVDLRIQVIKPGHVLPPALAKAIAPEKAPDNLDIDVRKHGNEPAEIEVRQNDKSWKVKENELDKLPDDIRPHVERLLGRGRSRVVIGAAGQKFEVALPPMPPIHERVDVEAIRKHSEERRKQVEEEVRRARQHAQSSIERQFEEMSREMERVRAQIDEMRKAYAEEVKAAAEAEMKALLDRAKNSEKEQGGEPQENEERQEEDELDQ